MSPGPARAGPEQSCLDQIQIQLTLSTAKESTLATGAEFSRVGLGQWYSPRLQVKST
jgi:hypothetical protein